MATVYCQTRDNDYCLQLNHSNAFNGNISRESSNESQDFCITAKDCYALKHLFGMKLIFI
jgi:hypothetical protein